MSAMIDVVSLVFQIYQFLIFIRVILSWVSATSYQPWLQHPAVRLLYQLTDPILVPIQRIVPPIGAGSARIDISPVIALILLEILRSILVSLLAGLL